MDLNTLQGLGAFGFGAIIGWYVYYVNRYRRGEVQLSDLTTLVGVIGGAAITQIYGKDPVLFGAYGIGLFIGFFGYLIFLAALVRNSTNFNIDYFLDGRRKKLAADETIPSDFQQPIRALDVDTRVAGLERDVATLSAKTQQPIPVIVQQQPVSTRDVDTRVAALERDVATLSAKTQQPAVPIIIQGQPVPPVTVPGAVKAEEVWAPSVGAKKVIDACKEAWNDDTKADCNKFVKAVASALGHPDFGAGEFANDIAADFADTNWLSTNGWSSVAGAAAAKTEADKGRLVVGAISGGNYVPPVDHGHVVVVVSSADLFKSKYPYAYWGKLNSVGEQNAPVTHAFNAASVDKVIYAARDV